jgi:hypothetical protein
MNMSDLKQEITKVNEFIEKYSLAKILKIMGVFFAGIILVNGVSSLKPTKYFDCAQQGTQVVDKVLACEQQKIDARIKDKELELEEYKINENYKLAKFKAVLSKIDLKHPEQLLSELESQALRSFSAARENCLDQAIQTMCEVKFK